MMRFLGILLLVCVAATAGWLAHVWFAGSAAHSAGGEESSTVHVLSGKLEQAIKSRGIVKPAPNSLVRVGFPMPKDVARRISELTWVEGDTVKAGQKLAQLDVSDLAATLAQLTSESKVFEQKIASLQALQPVETKTAVAKLAAAEALQAHTKRVHEKLSRLEGTTSSASTLELETARNNYAVAEAQLTEAQAAVEQVKERFRTDILVLESQLALAQTAIHTVEVQIRWGTLVSPINAQVFQVNQHQGELTSNNPLNPVLTLLDMSRLQLHAYVDEADFGQVRIGQKVRFHVDAHPGETIEGTTIRLLPQPILQENVVYYLAVVEVAKEQRSLLRPEMTALAHIETATKQQALTLPLSAVKSDSQGWYVMTPSPDGPVRQTVKIGIKAEGRIEIVEGLKVGDEVLEGP